MTGEYLLYLLMLHVLPKGFRETRCYGFIHPVSKTLIKLLQLVQRINPLRMLKQFKERATIICPKCGAAMKIIKTGIPLNVSDHGEPENYALPPKCKRLQCAPDARKRPVSYTLEYATGR